MKLTPPNKIPELARDLGIGEKHLSSLRVKYKTDEKLRATLQSWWKTTRDEPRLLARRSQQGYTHERGEALPGHKSEEGYQDEPEAVDKFTQKRLTAEARMRELQAVAGVIAAAEDVLSAIKEREAIDPGMRRAYWPLRRELDRAIQRERRKAA